MTSPEHTLVGIHLALALGVYRRCGWRSVALAGIASNVPDWDGLPMLFDMQRFEVGHRVWGHNVFAILGAALLLAFTQQYVDWIGSLGRWFRKTVRIQYGHVCADQLPATRHVRFTTLAMIAFVVQVVHLPCDMVVSGGSGLTDWVIRPWWPLWDTGYVFPLIPWGDVGPTVILMAGIIFTAQNPRRIALPSCVTLIVLCSYLAARGLW